MAEQREPRFAHETRARRLLASYEQAQRTISAQVQAALAAGDLQRASRRRSQLAAVLETLDQLGAVTDPDAASIVRDAFDEGAGRAATQIAGLTFSVPEVPGAFAGASSGAVQALEESILGRVGDARRTVGRRVDDVYARAGRRFAVQAVLGAEGSPELAARGLRRELARDGVTGFVDRAGRRWALSTYAEMAVRTVTREAVVQGSIARMASHGVDLARVSRHASACTICLPWEGRLVSLDGEASDYAGEPVATLGAMPNGGPPFHPRCAHTLQPVAVRIEAVRRSLSTA